jgi:integrase
MAQHGHVHRLHPAAGARAPTRRVPARAAGDGRARPVCGADLAPRPRLLRSILATAVEEDKILAQNPCRVRGAGTEKAPERPVLTAAQVFELAELIGRRPVGNIRRLPAGGYRLRFRRHEIMRTAPDVFRSRPAAEAALWAMGQDGSADCDQDRRYGALVLLATFASLRWGEAIALRRCDLDLTAGIVRVRLAYSERSTGELVLGPPKSRAGRRTAGRDHAHHLPDRPQSRNELIIHRDGTKEEQHRPGLRQSRVRTETSPG